MALIKIESFDVDVGANGSTYGLVNDVGNLNDAFVKINNATDKASGGPTGSTGNTAPSIAHIGVEMTGTSTLTFRRPVSNISKVVGEVWRYTGAPGGVHEFIVRGRFAITVTGTSASQAIAGVTNRNDCVPFITGVNINDTNVSNYELSTFGAVIDSGTNIVVSRGASGTTAIVYVTVVEFTGSSWSIGHGISSAHDSVTETITLNTDSSGSGGSTFDVGNWNNAFLEASMEGDALGETGLADVQSLVYPAGTTTQVVFSVIEADGSARNDGSGYIHALVNSDLRVNRASDVNVPEGNGTYGTVSWPAGASTSAALEALALEWFVSTSGTGTAHARGRLATRIINGNIIQHWVHRSGNTVRARYGVIDLSLLDVIGISDVDTDEQITNIQTGVIATGFGFEAVQGTGVVELVENSDDTGVKISQTVVSWADLSITFDTVSGALADTNCFLFVTNNSGDRSSPIALKVGNPPQTYQEAIESIVPAVGRYWMFQNNYIEEIGGADFNNVVSGGPVFVTSPLLCRGDTHSHELDGTTPDMHIETPDISEINLTTQTIRYMGGWIYLDRVQQQLVVLYEEGAQVNNIALIVGFGNILMVQFADTGDDYVQAYSSIKLTPGRAYHIMFKFEASAQDAEGRLFVDGIIDIKTNGNPWSATNIDAHSGNISMGHQPSELLQVGDSNSADNVDIAFATPTKCYYSQWNNWSGSALTPTQIREELFEKGARADVTIASDTEANMQISLDLIKNTVRPDVPLCILVKASTDGDFELVSDNITYNSRASIDIQYDGPNVLTWVNINGAVTNPAKLSTIGGGTITVIDTVLTTIEGIPQNAEWRLYEDSVIPGTIGTVELDGEENKASVGDLIYSDRYVSDTNVALQIMASGFQEKLIKFVLGSVDQIILVILETENNG